jgi:hypothetical protein
LTPWKILFFRYNFHLWNEVLRGWSLWLNHMAKMWTRRSWVPLMLGT